MHRFYKDLSTWIDQGCPISNEWRFDAICGICHNLTTWGIEKGLNNQEIDWILDELKTQLLHESLDPTYPFDNNHANYIKEENKFTNPWRLAWIKEHTLDIIEQDT